MAYKSWTEDENEFIKAHYASYGSKIYIYLPGRTRNACKNQAIKLGVATGRNWTKSEDAIIREFYPDLGAEVTKMLPNRTANACARRASYLGVSRVCREWTEKEDEIIKKHFPENGVKVAEMLVNRTESACQSRAKLLKVCKKPVWTDYEDKILVENYPSMKSKVHKHPGLHFKTKRDCIDRLKALGIVHEWTEADDKKIKKFYNDKGGNMNVMIADNVSKDDCNRRAEYLNVRTNHCKKWTEEEDRVLRRYYAIMGADVCYKLPGRTAEACASRANKLGLKVKK